jgi:hypothetical protein
MTKKKTRSRSAAATGRVSSLTPKTMIENVVDRLGRAKTLQLVEQVCAERRRLSRRSRE